VFAIGYFRKPAKMPSGLQPELDAAPDAAKESPDQRGQARIPAG